MPAPSKAWGIGTVRYDGGKEKRNKGKKCIVCPEFYKRQLIDRGHISAHAFFSKLSLYYFESGFEFFLRIDMKSLPNLCEINFRILIH